MVETIFVQRKTVRIAGADYPYGLVKSQFLKLDYSHIRYVMDCMEKTTSQIRNIKSYLLTALFNAPVTIESYYQMAVHSALHAGVK